ncbi:hypothetical protein TrST_g3097 [Triparma strigata]|uniref:Nicastrin n=1 Tax=Triparma strigata TaxID=1606541 RepID=A0A9W7BGX9_9STRA|nr:hypothetical protein TrST_g3097 [Triparma strigata]
MANRSLLGRILSLLLLLSDRQRHVMAGAGGGGGPANLDNPWQSRVHQLPDKYCTVLFRRSTHSTGSLVGCSTKSKSSAQTSPLIYLSTASEIETYVSTVISSPPTATLTAVIPASLFTNSTLTKLTSHSVTSIILLDDSTPASSPSTAQLLNLNSWGVPISLVQDAESQDLLKSLASSNAESSSSSSSSSSSYNFPYPRYESAFNYYMGPSTATSEICLNWQNLDGLPSPQCKPLGGQSIYASTSSPSSSSTVMIALKIDSTSFFHDLVPAANDAAASIVTALLASREIGRAISAAPSGSKNIAVGMFQGESYDSMGSLTFLKNTVSSSKLSCEKQVGDACLSPLYPDLSFQNLTDINTMIAIDQVGIIQEENKFFSHGYNGEGDSMSQIDYILQSLTTNNFSVQGSSQDTLPTTPLTSLISTHSNPDSVTGVVLSAYDSGYTDPNRYTRFDTYEKINLEAIAAAATLAARAALADAVSSVIEGGVDAAVSWAEAKIPEISVDDELLVELSTCFFESGSQCDLVKTSVASATADAIDATGYSIYSAGLGSPPNYYVGVYSSFYSQPYVVVDGRAMGGTEDVEAFQSSSSNFIGVQASELELTLKYLLASYLNTTAHFHPAVDTDLTPESDANLDMWVVGDGDTPLWTEPNWDSEVGLAVFNAGGSEVNTIFLDVISVLIFLATLAGGFKYASKWKREKLL